MDTTPAPVPSPRRRARPWPAIFGAPYDGVSCALCRQCEVELSVGLVGVRLAAFVEWPESAALGWEPSEFAHVYADNRAVAVREAVADNPLAKAVGVMAERAERWTGAAGALLPLLDARMNEAAKKHRSHPSTLAALGKALVRLAPDLRQVGVDVRRHCTGQDSDRCARTARPRGAHSCAREIR